jgi:hypothetical protein
MGRLAERAALRQDAARLLDELGGTVSEVAVSLGSMGIQVRPSNPHDSAAARFLHAVIGADNRVRQVKVHTRWLVLKTDRRWSPAIWVALPHPVMRLTVNRPRFGATGSSYWVDAPLSGWF